MSNYFVHSSSVVLPTIDSIPSHCYFVLYLYISPIHSMPYPFTTPPLLLIHPIVQYLDQPPPPLLFNSSISILTSGVESLSAAELELVVQCRLEQGRIAQQKQHAPMAARTVLAALKMLQHAHIFRQRKPQPPPPRYVLYFLRQQILHSAFFFLFLLCMKQRNANVFCQRFQVFHACIVEINASFSLL